MSKKFECEKCGKNFSCKQSLQKHGERKTPCNPILEPGETLAKYQCKRCGSGFSHSASMYRHMKKSCKLRNEEEAEKLKECKYQIQNFKVEELSKELESFHQIQENRIKELSDQLEEVKAKLGGAASPTSTADGCERKKKGVKGSLPKALRNATWNKYIGVGVGESFCFCCRLEPILQTNFVCGHVQSRAKGGKDSLENLRPVCGACNSSMGVKNMEDFAKECGFRMSLPLTQAEESILAELYS
jgi:hypothetical protein